MFKKIMGLGLILVLLFSFGACGNKGNDDSLVLGKFEGLDTEVELEIVKAHWGDDFEQYGHINPIIDYYGNYNDCVVVSVMAGGDWGLGLIPYLIYIDGGAFVRFNKSMKVWNNGILYKLQKACDLGLLGEDELERIVDRNKEFYPELYAEYPEYYSIYPEL